MITKAYSERERLAWERQLYMQRSFVDKGLGAPCHEKTLEKSELELTAPRFKPELLQGFSRHGAPGHLSTKLLCKLIIVVLV